MGVSQSPRVRDSLVLVVPDRYTGANTPLAKSLGESEIGRALSNQWYLWETDASGTGATIWKKRELLVMKSIDDQISTSLQAMHKEWGSCLALGVILFLIGYYALFAGEAGSTAGVIAIATVLIIAGLMQVISAFMVLDAPKTWRSDRKRRVSFPQRSHRTCRSSRRCDCVGKVHRRASASPA